MSSWTPHKFQQEGERQGYPKPFVEALLREGKRLQRLGMPVIFTMGHLAAVCGVPYRFLYQIVNRTTEPYRVFNIRKRTKGFRQITVPAPSLFRVQRWIHDNILKQCSPHRASTAFVEGCNPRENARRHCGAQWLVKIDITDFFEAISEREVFRVFRDAGFPALIAFQFSRLCTRVSQLPSKYRGHRWQPHPDKFYKIFATPNLGHLPQGAPSSPLLANLVCKSLDVQLENISEEFGCVYTRYADDIVFSASELTRRRACEIISKVSVILREHGFQRNRQKTHVIPPGARKVVTGLLVDRSEPHLTTEYKENILVHLYHARTKTIHGHCQKRGFRSLLGFRSHLDGLITYSEFVDPLFGERCRSEFNALPWGDLLQV